MSTYYRVPKTQFGAWITNFHAVAAAHASALGLDPAELTSISNAMTEFNNAFSAQETARAASIGATALADQEWRQALDLVASFNAQFQAIPGISPELLAELGLNVPGGGGGTVPVYAPSDLAAMGCSDGINTLKWNRNGNESGTVYVIEAAYDGTSDWQIVDNSTRVKYSHTGQEPGRFVRYRVVAQRGSTKSGPSNTASVYDPGQGASLGIAA